MRRRLSRRARGLAIAAIAGTAACGTARIIERTPSGGVIELEGDHNKAMEQANEAMAAQCSSHFIVVRDGYEPTSAATPAPGASVPTAFRVHYECGDGATVGAPPAAPPR
ncbi:MAG TPA: hypothetical protein VK607_11470 [Kofleriaceae bacterium]|nr:hypothetical protein [Kofleriaceae bacterium]